jgi:cytochrome c-type biogenesis protein CcmH/NrfG
MTDEGKPPLGSWRRFHGLVLAILVVLIALFSVGSWVYR